jgi:hypothetical protein
MKADMLPTNCGAKPLRLFRRAAPLISPVISARDTIEGKQPLKVAIFLVSLQADPGEKTNLAGQHPEIVARLRRLHDQHFD